MINSAISMQDSAASCKYLSAFALLSIFVFSSAPVTPWRFFKIPAYSSRALRRICTLSMEECVVLFMEDALLRHCGEISKRIAADIIEIVKITREYVLFIFNSFLFVANKKNVSRRYHRVTKQKRRILQVNHIKKVGH